MNTAIRASILALLLFVAACAPTTASEAEPAPQLLPPEGQQAWSAQVHGIEIKYQMTTEDTQQGEFMATGAGAMWSPLDDECNFYFLPKYFQTPAAGMEQATFEYNVSFVITSVGYCLHFFVVDPEGAESEDQYEWASAWAALYLERCGYVVHPLGWQNNDSTCTPPAPEDVQL